MPFMQQSRHDRLRLTKRLTKRKSRHQQYMEIQPLQYNQQTERNCQAKPQR